MLFDSGRRGATRRLRAAAGVLAAALGAAALLVDGPHIRPIAAPSSAGPPAAADPVQAPASSEVADAPARSRAVRRLLDERARAVLHRDRTAFLATVDANRPAFAAAQAESFDHLAAVPLSGWSYDLDPRHERPGARDRLGGYGAKERAWAPSVTLRYELAGFDAVPVSEPQSLTFVVCSAGWRIAADADFDGTAEPTGRGLWDYGPVQVERGERSLVLGHPRPARSAGGRPGGTLADLAAAVDRGVLAVTRVWGKDWAQRVVVLVPADAEELTRVLRPGGDLTRMAAVATGGPSGDGGRPGDGGGQLTAGQRIVVNPPNFDRLGAAGRRVVLTHEITHLATRAATGPLTPTWLVEGLADHVAYLDSGLDVPAAAPELRAEVRAAGLPDALPGDADFDGGSGRLPAVYQMSWLACRLLAETAGRPALLRLYRQVGQARTGSPERVLAVGLADVVHQTPEQFTAASRAYLWSRLAPSGPP